MIDRATIDKIIDATNIVEVVGDFISLKKRGVNHLACCPFHNEKTPSFSVSAAKGIYKCFGCGKAGNAVNFVMEHEHLTYVEALKYLGKKYGIEVKEKELTDDEVQVGNKRESMMIVSAYAQDYFSKTLWEHPDGKNIGLSYFRERGFSDKTIKKFQLGYCLDSRSAFSNTALKDGYKREYLVATGLSIERNEDLLDRFFGRVLFPIHSISGRVIAFGGRTLKQDKNIAKYLNSPESEIYIKSNVLYGIFQAKQAIVRTQKCYLVEGYTDVISMHQAGVENVVASSGTSLTTEQIRLIKRFSPNVTVLYDGDAAGIKASLRGIDMLLEDGLNVKVALFPDGDDPDSFARKHSVSELEAFLSDAEQDFISFKTKLLTQEAKKDPIQRASLISDVVRSISMIPDTITRTVYVKECSRLMEMEEEVLSGEVAKLRRKRLYEGTKATELSSLPSEAAADTPTTTPIPFFVSNIYSEASEKELLYFLLKYGEKPLFVDAENNTINVAEYIISELRNDELELQNLLYRKIFDEYIQILKSQNEDCLKHFINHPNQNIMELAINVLSDNYQLSIESYIKSEEPEDVKLRRVIPYAIAAYKSNITKQAFATLSEQLHEAQKLNDSEQVLLFLERLRTLQSIRNSFAKDLHRLTT
ncbi:MAG: DNA primase [Prevotellaceae bacterium]|jgi:DNA primase|nr:DNA primase [Prevotellaceae bacterium]